MTPTTTSPLLVIPAKAGIHHPLLKFRVPVMDPRLRGGDEFGVGVLR
jgi:hypothetical protein